MGGRDHGQSAVHRSGRRLRAPGVLGVRDIHALGERGGGARRRRCCLGTGLAGHMPRWMTGVQRGLPQELLRQPQDLADQALPGIAVVAGARKPLAGMAMLHGTGDALAGMAMLHGTGDALAGMAMLHGTGDALAGMAMLYGTGDAMAR